MIYTGNIHLADDLIYIYMYCTGQYKINRYPRALQPVTADLCADQLFSRFPHMAAPEPAHLELSRHRPACSALNY